MKRTSFFLLLFVLVFLSVSTLLALMYTRQPQNLQNQATGYTIPPEDQRATVPTGALLLNGGVGITNGAAMNAGNFQVEQYCPRKGLGAVSSTSTDWFCGNHKITVTEFDEICRLTYSVDGAFVLKTGTSATTAYNWRCYNLPVSSVVSPTPSPSTSPSPSGSPRPRAGISDLDRNGKKDANDYKLFIEDYVK